MKKLFAVIAILSVAGCTTPKTVLKNHKTGQVVTCGGSATGSLVGGVVGYHIEKSNDADCTSTYMEQGFKKIKETKGSDDIE